jgi:hypothetical protein
VCPRQAAAQRCRLGDGKNRRMRICPVRDPEFIEKRKQLFRAVINGGGIAGTMRSGRSEGKLSGRPDLQTPCPPLSCGSVRV